MLIDAKGLRGFRPDRRRRSDPDETDGRALYRAHAEAEASRSVNMARRVTYALASGEHLQGKDEGNG